MRAVRIPLESALAPRDAVRALRGDARPFALVGDWAGGGALLGSEPVRVARRDEDPFALLDEQPAVEAGDAVVGGGWFGVLGYRLGHLVEDLPADPPAPAPTPAAALAFHDHVVRFDGERWWFEALWSDHRDAALTERLNTWRERIAGPAPPAHDVAVRPFAPRAPGERAHLDAVADCLDRIAAGDLFQANLTLRLEATWSGDAVDLAAAALARGSRFAAFFGRPDGAVVSLSPERFLRRHGRRVETEPIKGTGDDPAVLAASAKDAAEHVMIVDLMRNDLGRVCAYGTIEAHPPRIEAHANVFHMVSSVTGTLRDDATDADLLRATFPPGSVTGAPKVQALKVISELEPTRREAYTGAIGYASPIAGLELSVAIRTFETKAERIWLGAGGGIVADSRPDRELAEALDKARGPLAAVGAQLRGLPLPRAPRAIPRALDHGPRPDPRHGLLETIMVTDGEPRHLDDHLARLARSAEEVYELDLPPATAERIVACAARATGPARLRVVARPGARGLELDVAVASIGERQTPHGLTPFVLPGGLGAHKWADRRLAEALAAAAAPPGHEALLVDADGAVLEASWANIWIVEGDAWLTPPADGRLLAGVGRAELLATERRAREERIDLARLAAADEVLLTSALRTRRVGPRTPVAV